MRNVLYRVYDGAGELLYVGATTNPGVRLREHHQDRSWWDDVSNITLEHFETAEELFAAETAAIKAENPTYNHIPFQSLSSGPESREESGGKAASIGAARMACGSAS